MTKAAAETLARKQCISRLCSDQSPEFCTKNVDSLQDIRGAGNSSAYFETEHELGIEYDCNFTDKVFLEFVLTPTTQKIFKLYSRVGTEMNCNEFTAFVKEEFHVGDPVIDPHKASPCEASWTSNVGYNLRFHSVESNGAKNSYYLTIINQEVIKQNETAAEYKREHVMTKPRL
jgi:hypothetical protein